MSTAVFEKRNQCILVYSIDIVECYHTYPSSQDAKKSIATPSIQHLCYIQRAETHLVVRPNSEQGKNILVDTLERRNSLALLLIQGVVDNGSVGEVDLSLWLLPRECVLLPVLVVSLWVILAGVCTTGLLSVGRGLGGLNTTNPVSKRSTNHMDAPLTRKSTSS